MGYSGYTLRVLVSLPAYGGEPRPDEEVLEELALAVEDYVRGWALEHSFSHGEDQIRHEVEPSRVVVNY